MENNRINWLKIIIEVLIIFVFAIILVWIFPMPGKNTKSNYDENFETFRNTAKNYFTVDRLPKNVGDSVRLSLEEMINKNIIRELKDENGKSCDVTKSYVLVSKVSDTNYQLRVELSCGNETDYVLDTIGCYDTCKYETDKKVNNNIPSNNSNEYKNTTNTKVGTIVQYRYMTQRVVKEVSYKCEDGYALNGTKCVKLRGLSVAATAQYSEDKDIYMEPITVKGPTKVIYDKYLVKDGRTTAACPSGFSYNKATDSCEKAANKHTRTIDDSYSYAGTPITKYSAWAFSRTTTSTAALKSNDTTKYEVTNTASKYVCNAKECPGVVVTYTYNVYTRTKYVSYECPNGGNPSGSNCYVSGSHNEDYYSCDNDGTLSGTICKTTPKKDVEKIYYCPDGYQSSGSDMNLVCFKEIPTNDTYYCSDASYSYNDKLHKCVKHIDKEFIGYKCPTGYQLDGDKCYKSGETVDAKKWTKCIVITTYTWNSSTSLSGWTKTGETRTIKN